MKLRTKKLVLFAVLAAILIIMAFTPIGYLKVGVVEITFMMIPVIICAAATGIFYGAMAGLVFGLTSFIQCFGMSPFGALLLELNPILAFLGCVIPRVLLGVFAALVFKGLSKTKLPTLLTDVITMLSSAIVHTVVFVALLILSYGRTEAFINAFGEDFWTAVWIIVGFNGLIEWAVCATVGAAILKAVQFFFDRYGKTT